MEKLISDNNNKLQKFQNEVQVYQAEVNTEVGNIDVTDPAVASTLGLSPSDAAIAGRQIRKSNLMRQTP